MTKEIGTDPDSGYVPTEADDGTATDDGGPGHLDPHAADDLTGRASVLGDAVLPED